MDNPELKRIDDIIVCQVCCKVVRVLRLTISEITEECRGEEAPMDEGGQDT
jgi:hypothetical protein